MVEESCKGAFPGSPRDMSELVGGNASEVLEWVENCTSET